MNAEVTYICMLFQCHQCHYYYSQKSCPLHSQHQFLLCNSQCLFLLKFLPYHNADLAGTTYNLIHNTRYRIRDFENSDSFLEKGESTILAKGGGQTWSFQNSEKLDCALEKAAGKTENHSYRNGRKCSVSSPYRGRNGEHRGWNLFKITHRELQWRNRLAHGT